MHHGTVDASAPGSRFVLVLRHAKAASSAAGGDRGRPLVGRGRRDARALGHRLAAGATALGFSVTSDEPLVLPARVLCSSAARTRETAELVVSRLPVDHQPAIEVVDELYGASAATVMSRVRELDDSVTSVLVVGHNPTMFQFTWELLDPSSADRAALERHGFPTCTLAMIELPRANGWQDVGRSPSSLCGLVSPPY